MALVRIRRRRQGVSSALDDLARSALVPAARSMASAIS
jgi:hypothetical protein